MYCSKCGSTVAAGATFCSKCGQSQAAYAAPLAIAVGAPPLAAPPLAAPPAYAGFWLRFLAYIVDAIILGACVGPILVGIAMAMGVGSSLRSLPRGDDSLAWTPAMFGFGFLSICVLVGLVGGWLYHALLESSEWQATAGKKVLGLAVTDLAGRRISFARASGRHFGKIVTSLIPLGIGYILAGITEKKQAIHDMLAGSLVMRKS
jgi:uncharacterized RDD family membrane protein YckC